METDDHFQSLRIPFGVASKGAISPGSPYRAPSERDAPLLEPSFIHLAKFLGIRALLQVPQRERRYTCRALFIRLSKSVVNEPHFQVPQWGPYGETCSSPEPFLHNLQ
jgi:hypothetical protein